MKQFFEALKRAPKRSGVLAVLAAAIVVPAALFAWGPTDRPTYTTDNPADHVTFNSMTNNPAFGDERYFVQIKDASKGNESYTDKIELEGGKEYQVYVYFHNNASSTYNSAEHNYKGIAKDTMLRMSMPARVQAGQEAKIGGVISASNAQPSQVWDYTYLTSKSDVGLRVVPGSATIHSHGAVNGAKLPNELFETGTKLGYNALDGKVPGCDEFAGYVTYRFKVDKPNFEVKKTVAKADTTDFKETISAKPSEEVSYKVHYKNTGTTQQNDVVIKDMLPNGVSYVPGTTKLATSTTGGYVGVADGITSSTGINIGSYAPNGDAYIKFKAKVSKAEKLACGKNTLVNTAAAETNNGTKKDTATVVVEKECVEPKIEVCELATKKVILIDAKQYDSSKHSKNLDDCKVTPVEKEIEVCVLETKTVTTIKESEFDSTKHSTDMSDCEETPVTPEVPETPETPETPTTPETPEVVEETPEVVELPKTGASDVLLAGISLSSIITAAGYMFANRRAL